MIPGARLILLGRQGAGKGTQCVRLSRHFVVPHISTGDMLRAAVREGTELGRMAKQVMDAGGLGGDEIMVGLVEERLDHDDTRTRGYILDGFPRNVSQADEMARRNVVVERVVLMSVPEEALVARLAGRRVCTACGSTYHVDTLPTRVEGVCDACGGSVVQRKDDEGAVIAQRLQVYATETAPLVDYYTRAGLLRRVDGLGETAAVFASILGALDT